MASNCYHLLSLCRIRVARLESNGVPDPGAGNLYVSDAAINLVVGLEISEGTDHEQKNGCGDICFAFTERDKIKGLNLEIQLCDADPEMAELLTGGELLTSGGETVGYALPPVGEVGNEFGVSIEAWTKNIDGSTLDANYPYVRWVFPKTFWTFADKTLEDAPIVQAFTGKGEENVNWFDGPANDWDYTSDRLFQYAGDVALPAATCGATALAVS